MDPFVSSLIDFGRAVVARGLLASTCGNISLLVGEDLLISASGSTLEALEPEAIARVRLADGEHLTGPKPSMETDLHRRVYQIRPRAEAVLHCQSRAATLLSCLADPPRNLDLIPEVPAYVRDHAYVPYAAPGSDALADHVAQAFADPEVTVVQMQNHGQVIIGSSWRSVLRRAVFFELACSFVASGLPLRTIPEGESLALRDYARDV